MSTRRFPACIMGTAVVPWTADYALDEALFRHEIATLMQADYRHQVLWHLHDPRFPLRLLPPYQGADPAAAGAFLAFLKERFPNWAP